MPSARRLLHCLMPCSSYCPRVLCMPACCGRISCSSFVLAGSTCCHLVRGPLLLDLRSALSCVRYRGLLGVRCLICLRLSVSVGRLDLDFVKEIGECEHSKSKIFLASRGGASRPARPSLKSGPPTPRYMMSEASPRAGTSTKSFLTHHLRRVSKAAVVHDAMAIRKQITCLKQQAFGCVAYAAGAGEVEA